MKVEQINVLFIGNDDDEAARLRRFLNEMPGCAVSYRQARSSAEARQAAADTAVDAFLVDAEAGAGLDVVRSLRQSDEIQPLIFVGGDAQLHAAALRLGADECLSKSTLDAEAVRTAFHDARANFERRRVAQDNARQLKELQDKNSSLEHKNRRLVELYDTAHDFLDHVSHELRTPLTVIKEFTSIMADGLAGETTPRQKEHLGTVLSRIDDLATMIDDMLDINRLEAGFMGMWRRPVEFADIIEPLRAAMERKAAYGEAKLCIDGGDRLPLLFCDAEKIGRVLINLLMQAIKHSPVNGQVRIFARHEPRQAAVRVGISDEGPGLDAARLSDLAAWFKEKGGNLRAATTGFGLGLGIARELVRLNFGDMEVTGKPGVGTTVGFTIPVFEPVSLMKRYLDRVGDFRDDASFVSMIEARTEPDCDPRFRDEVDHFLHFKLRRNDLVFRIGPDAWNVIVASNQRSQTQIIRRMEQAWYASIRQRPGDIVYALTFKTLGTWSIEGERSELIREAGRRLGHCEAAVARGKALAQ